MTKRYRPTACELYPVLGLEEVKEGGVEIPATLVRRFKQAELRFHEAEEAILEHLGQEARERYHL